MYFQGISPINGKGKEIVMCTLYDSCLWVRRVIIQIMAKHK